ncbi:MAG: hypothetical protein VYA86_04590 [Candidatus Thermoplasmatota archaeon]|nr:hypothetical protein [Candidatus Thermoplasmatota archaeon]
MSLLDLPAFSGVAKVLREAALKLRTSESAITIAAPLDEEGVFASALLEAALLDAGIPYQRRLRESPQPAKGPSIVIGAETVSQLPVISSDPLCIQIAPVEVDALVSSSGDARKGVVSTVALCAALGYSISAGGSMTRLLLPWSLTGNWLSEGMEHTYDPVYTVLRDYLSDEGIIRVVPMPEVPEINPESMPGIEEVALGAIRDRWGQLDLEGRAQSISHLLKPLLDSETPSTARFEELGWHRVLSVGWERDLASQLTAFCQTWRENPGGRRIQAGDAIDHLLRTGQLP